MIIASAIRLKNGSIYVGKRHGDCFTNYKLINKLEKPDQNILNAEQGFMNDQGQYMNREQAYYEARRSNQCEIQSSDGSWPMWFPQLLSEDLW